jgi:DNA end-binding protein Ku
MAPRANWKGYLRLSLVSCAVALYPAVSGSERVALHFINRKTRHRLKQQYVDSESGKVVEKEDRVRGYEVSKGDYLPIEDDELQEVRLESAHTIDIDRFVDRSRIDDVYLDSRYYLAPEDKVGEEAFVVIREAMRKKGVAGLARVVLYGRERALLLEPRDKGLVATTLHYQWEVRDSSPYFDDIPDVKLTSEMLDLAAHIIESKKGDFDSSLFTDRYRDALVELIRAKQAGRPPPEVRDEAAPSNVINLMDALRRSLSADEGKAAKPSTGKRATAPASERRTAAASSRKSKGRRGAQSRKAS